MRGSGLERRVGLVAVVVVTRVVGTSDREFKTMISEKMWTSAHPGLLGVRFRVPGTGMHGGP